MNEKREWFDDPEGNTILVTSVKTIDYIQHTPCTIEHKNANGHDWWRATIHFKKTSYRRTYTTSWYGSKTAMTAEVIEQIDHAHQQPSLFSDGGIE